MASINKNSRQHLLWYEKKRHEYQSLSEIISATLRSLLKNSKIDFIDIPFRAKTMVSFGEKIKRKQYKNPISEMMDLAGIRVITYIEDDVAKVANLIKSSFNIHQEESGDKSVDLGEDRFGYRSVHFVCDIGLVRQGLAEFAPYGGMMFEIQVRTALQHTWAEIEHDRSYKFSGELPPKIKRRFHLVAGLLELADREFNELTNEIDQYSKETHKKAGAGNLDIELNSTTILEYLKFKLAKKPLADKIELVSIRKEVIDELNAMKINSLSDLDNFITADFLSAENRYIKKTNSFGILRDAMMYGDMKKYFSNAWQQHWHGLDEDSVNLLASKYGRPVVKKTVNDYKLDIIDEFFPDTDD